MTVSTVGVTKKRVRVIEQKTNHSIEYENDVYVVDTSDPTLVLQTGSSSGVDLTGSNTLSSQADSTTTIASGSNSTATIGSGNLSTVNIGTGTNSVTYLKSNTIRMGSDVGNHNIYVGSYNAPSGDAIKIGDSPSTYVTVGTVAQYANSNTTSFSVLSKDVQIGQTLNTSSLNTRDTNLKLYGGEVRSRATGDYEVAALGNIKLVSNDAGLNDTGTRTYLSMISGAASLAHVNSGNSILSKVDLNGTSAAIYSSGSTSIDAGTTLGLAAGTALGLAADTLVTITSGTSTLITTAKGTISLSANSDDATLGDINLNADNNANVTTTKGNITLTANSTDATLGDINLDAYNDVDVSSTNGDVSLTATSADSNSGSIYLDANTAINISSAGTASITCQEALNLDVYTQNSSTEGKISMYSDGIVEILSGKTKTGTTSAERRTGLVVRNEDITFRRRVGENVVHTAGYGNGSAADSYPVPSTAGDRFYSSSGFYSGVGSTADNTAAASSAGYAPFTGVHMFDIQPDSNISIGDAVIVVNHTAMLTTTPNDKRVVGIACEILENNRISVASVGDNECGQLKGFKVCNENGTISAGDLLTTSSTAGYLMKQSDDIMRSSTVGKSAVDVVFDNNNLAVDVYGFIYCG